MNWVVIVIFAVAFAAFGLVMFFIGRNSRNRRKP